MLKLIFLWEFENNKYDSFKHFDKLSSLISGSGILANEENSSINLPISSTCLDMVFVKTLISSLSNSLFWYFFSILSADNLTGVNGFLTSWAIFLAISDHAACFSANINDVVSSIATI